MNSKKFKELINGEEVYVELIDDGEFEIVNPKYYDLLEGVGETYNIRDLLLILLGVNYKEISLTLFLYFFLFIFVFIFYHILVCFFVFLLGWGFYPIFIILFFQFFRKILYI